MAPPANSVSALEHTAVGALAGVLEVAIMQVRSGQTATLGAAAAAAAASARSATSRVAALAHASRPPSHALQPTVGVKNALQEGRPIPRTVPGLYRGIGVRGACLPLA